MAHAARCCSIALASVLVACGPSGGDAPDGGASSHGQPLFCARMGDDPVRDLFCGAEPVEITGIASLSRALELTSAQMLGHSTALGGRAVSALNPRIILYRGEVAEGQVAALAFTRGLQRAELIAQDPTTKALRFYLLEFEQACNEAAGGCSPGDLFTPAIEESWLEVRIRDDEELKNTPDDCRRCHGGGQGEQATPILLMREYSIPWMHWFSTFGAVRGDYLAAKKVPSDAERFATEPYAGYSLHEVLDGAMIQGQITRSGQFLDHPAQPLLFPSYEIGVEAMQYLTAPGLMLGPGLDEPERTGSSTWRGLYDAFLAGQGPAPPYHHDRITDAAKLAVATDAYQRFLAGTLPREELPDISDVLLDDPQRQAEMGFVVAPDADGPSLLRQACFPCHNGALDQTISRARFDADIASLSAEQLELAIARLELDESDPLRMPPADARTLDPEARARLIEHLRAALE